MVGNQPVDQMSIVASLRSVFYVLPGVQPLVEIRLLS